MFDFIFSVTLDMTLKEQYFKDQVVITQFKSKLCEIH